MRTERLRGQKVLGEHRCPSDAWDPLVRDFHTQPTSRTRQTPGLLSKRRENRLGGRGVCVTDELQEEKNLGNTAVEKETSVVQMLGSQVPQMT